VAVADRVLSRCHELAPEAVAHESADSLVAAGAVDAVVIATPAASHRADAAAAAGAGLPALVEKPPAADAADARSIAGLEPAPWIGFNRRFEPGLQRLRSGVPAEGELELAFEVHHPGGPWGSHVVRDDALLAHGPHLIDLARWLSRSEIERVRAVELSSERAVLELALVRGRAEISCGVGSPARDQVVIRTPGRTLRYRAHGASRRFVRRLSRPRMAGALVHLLMRELEEFAGAARGAAPALLAGAADGVAVMRAIDAVRASAASGSDWRVVDGLGDPPGPAGRLPGTGPTGQLRARGRE